MHPIHKKIVWTAIGILVFFMLAPLIGELIPLHFASLDAEDNYEGIRAIIAAICIVVAMSGIIKKSDGVGIKVLKIGFAIIVTIVLLFVLVLLTFADGMCRWSTLDVLFQKKDNPSIQIVRRDFGCGAVDSSAPLADIIEAHYIGAGLMLTFPADTAKLDRSAWVRVAKEQ